MYALSPHRRPVRRSIVRGRVVIIGITSARNSPSLPCHSGDSGSLHRHRQDQPCEARTPMDREKRTNNPDRLVEYVLQILLCQRRTF